MAGKFDLEKMLAEIKEDEEMANRKSTAISQVDIQRLIREKRKHREEKSDD